MFLDRKVFDEINFHVLYSYLMPIFSNLEYLRLTKFTHKKMHFIEPKKDLDFKYSLQIEFFTIQVIFFVIAFLLLYQLEKINYMI